MRTPPSIEGSGEPLRRRESPLQRPEDAIVKAEKRKKRPMARRSAADLLDRSHEPMVATIPTAPQIETSQVWQALPPLRFASSQHKSCTGYDQNYADCGRYLFVVVRGHADVGIAKADAMMLGVREWHEEGNDPQHQNYNSNQQ
jgi:hypothetical protein